MGARSEIEEGADDPVFAKVEALLAGVDASVELEIIPFARLTRGLTRAAPDAARVAHAPQPARVSANVGPTRFQRQHGVEFQV